MGKDIENIKSYWMLKDDEKGEGKARIQVHLGKMRVAEIFFKGFMSFPS